MRNIVVTDYKTEWHDAFLELKEYLLKEINIPNLRIEHLGSTSVKGLSAKPIIDLAIIVKNHEEFLIIKEALENIGYVHRGNLGIEQREAFKSIKPNDFYDHHLYVAYEKSLGLRNMLTIRDHLRNNKDDVIKYSDLKKALAKKFPHDIGSYIAGKTEFIISILKQYDFEEDELEKIRKINSI